MNAQIDFAKMQGLVPAIVQADATGEVLMLGFMNAAAFDKTLRGGYVTFFSRTRNELWTKGESSGNRLKVVSIATDCDRDTFLIRVQVEGAGVVCHLGTRSCFTQEIPFGANADSARDQEIVQ
jgi:phosphoribosyl-ATP pyrophosphohydrolase/phosphoribosyl-AMP cyclohydrolase